MLILAQKIFFVITRKPVKKVFKVIEKIIEIVFPKLYQSKLEKLKKGLKYGSFNNTEKALGKPRDIRQSRESLIWKYEKKILEEESPLVSVIVPNYNHEAFLRERLESIYGQTYQNIEVILLDDGSTDRSVEILREYQKKYPDKTQIVVNEGTCKGTFSQWLSGIQKATGKYVWIAESDDYCEKNFLKVLLPYFQYESVMVAFAYSSFVQNGKEVGNTREYLADLPALDFSKPFIMTAHNLVNNGFAVHNLIANVSSAVFRKTQFIEEDAKNLCNKMKLSFDWVFYLSLIKGGTCAYSNRTTNYYRLHENSTSIRVQKSAEYYREFAQVSEYIIRNYRVNRDVFDVVLKNLKDHYDIVNSGREDIVLEELYSLDHIKNLTVKRRINIVMTVYALIAGGGEIYPLRLANEMHRQGMSVTVLNFEEDVRNENVRQILNASIPLVTLKNCDYMYQVIEGLGADVIHSHHAYVDEAIAMWFQNHNFHCNHFITLHGIYELTKQKDLKRILPVICGSAKKIIYIADKNLIPFKENGFFSENQFIKLSNGLPEEQVAPIERRSLGIKEEDFVFVIASRGLLEKGWIESAEAVKKANEIGRRKIHLVILGDGEAKKVMEATPNEFVHLVGVQNNVRQYYRMADAGILATRFLGESYPLTIIECLQCNRPVIATDIAEISRMLRDENGNFAGELLHLNNGQLDIEEMTDKILKLSEQQPYYEELKSRCVSASKKFNIADVGKDYLNIYYESISDSRRE